MSHQETERYNEQQEELRQENETMKHTPGPWKLAILKAYKFDGTTSKEAHFKILKESEGVTQEVIGSISGRNPANAHLIAAAPEMIEALKNLVDRDLIKYTDGDHYQEVLEAIAKAEGKS